LARELAARGADVVALDGSPAMLEQARGAGLPPGQRIRYDLIESVERLPLPDGVTDGILCSSVLEYVETPAAALAEFHRVLRPGGILVLTVPNRWSVIRGAQASVRALSRLVGQSPYGYLSVSLHSYSRSSLRRTLDRVGFEVEELSQFSPWQPGLLVPLGLGALWLGVARRRESRFSA
jgi:2-polyprenyl-6-hydroxyphenyl methylase/3-demethylubiquinone-9 3-methyltransferase